jgi:chromosome segregation ATPase
MSEELFYQNQLQNLEDIKASYISQLDEVEKKRAEIVLKREQIKADEAHIIEEYHKIRDAKKLITTEFENLANKSEILKQAKKEYEKKQVVFLKLEAELATRMDKYDIDTDSLQKRNCDQYRVLRAQLEEELALRKKQKSLERTRNRLESKVKEIAEIRKGISSGEMDIEIETEKIERRREYVRHMRDLLSEQENEFSSREKELVQLKQKTEDEISKQVTIHRQQLDIIKKDARIEQQMAYIKILEDDLYELKNRLQKANEKLNNMKVFSSIFEQNQELLAN